MRHSLICTFILVSARLFAQSPGLPATLSLPNDRDSIEETEPTFVWQANTAAIVNDPRLDQQIVVVEMLEDQTPAEALVLNPPIFIRRNLKTGSIPYSANDHKLEKGKSYAWQVSYLFNDIAVQQSEAWMFTIADPVPPARHFVALRRQNDGSVYTIGSEELNVSSTEKGELQLNAIIRTPDGKRHKVQLVELIAGKPVEQKVSVSSTETRYFTVDLSDLDLKKGVSTFEWNGGKQSYTVNFQID